MAREVFKTEGEELSVEDAKIDLVTVAERDGESGSEIIEWIESLSDTELRSLWFVLAMMRDEGRAPTLRSIFTDKPDLYNLAKAIKDSAETGGSSG